MRYLSVVLLLVLPGCSDDTKPASGGDCPASKPTVGQACSLTPSDKVCEYQLPVTCSCGISGTPTSSCGCQQGKWTCQDHSDVCTVCPDRGPDRSIGVAREAGAADRRVEAGRTDRANGG